MTWSRIAGNLQALAAHSFLLCFTCLIIVKVTSYFYISWWYVNESPPPLPYSAIFGNFDSARVGRDVSWILCGFSQSNFRSRSFSSCRRPLVSCRLNFVRFFKYFDFNRGQNCEITFDFVEIGSLQIQTCGDSNLELCDHSNLRSLLEMSCSESIRHLFTFSFSVV